MIQIETERLIIRDRTTSDLEDLHSILSDSKVMYYLPDIETVTKEESEENLKVSINEIQSKNRSKYFFDIYEKKTLEHIGEIGYTTEAARAVMDYAFTILNCYKVETDCVSENYASEKVMIKLGMKKETELRKHTLLRGKIYDRLEYGILKEDGIRCGYINKISEKKIFSN